VNPFTGALRNLEPWLRPPTVEGGDVAYCTYAGAIGDMVLAVTSDGTVLACSFGTETEVTQRIADVVSPRVLRQPYKLDRLRAQLDEYLAGNRREIDLPYTLALAGSWGTQVLEAVKVVPYASTTTYAEIARAVQAPNASRAVGNALAGNPLCVVLPCHRVLRSDGQLGGYAGGPEAKQVLLDLESHVAAASGERP
jgi:methylated-DNA-[protein]-cysteine S-methyltransferase